MQGLVDVNLTLPKLAMYRKKVLPLTISDFRDLIQ